MKNPIVILIALCCSIQLFAQPLYPFKKGSLWGYMDSNGNEIIVPQFPLAGFFYEDRAYVQIDDALGFINSKGEVVIKPQYPAADNFREGFSSAMEDEDWGIINAAGEWVIEPKYATPMPFHNGLAKFKLERGLFSTYGFINTKGDTAIAPVFEKAGDFNDGLCMASKDGSKYGYINTKGEWVIQPEYEIGVAFKINGEYDFSDKDFSNGYVAVEKDSKYGLMDKTGKLVLPCTFEFIGKFSEGLAPAKKGDKYGFIDIKGNWIIKPEYTGAEAFHNGLAAVSKGPSAYEATWGFIDAKGKIIIPLTIYAYYTSYRPMQFHEGVVPCYVSEGKFGYINRSGKVIWKME